MQSTNNRTKHHAGQSSVCRALSGKMLPFLPLLDVCVVRHLI